MYTSMPMPDLPLDLNCEVMDVRDNRKVPMGSVTAMY